MLYNMPLYRSGLSLFADGLFSSNKEIASLSSAILKKVAKCEPGALALS